MSDWKAYLKPSEEEVLAEVEAWAGAPAGRLSRALTMAGRPFDLAFGLMPPALKEGLGQAIHRALSTLRRTSVLTFSPQALLDRISAGIGLDVGTEPDQVFRADVRDLDGFALEILAFHRRVAALQGAAAGAAGLVGFLGDVPALYTLLYRCIQEIAVCYGFPVRDEYEEAHMLKVLDLGHFLEDERRRVGFQELATLQDMIRSGTPLQDMERFAVAKGLQALSRRLAGGLARRKTAQAVALVGGLVGAGVNFQLVSDVGTVAFQAYRRRFVVEVARRRMHRATRRLEPQSPGPEGGASNPGSPGPEGGTSESGA